MKFLLKITLQLTFTNYILCQEVKVMDSSMCEPDRSLHANSNDIKINYYDPENRKNITCRLDDASYVITSNIYRMDPKNKLIVFIPKFQIEQTDISVIETFWDVANVSIIIIDYSVYTGTLNEQNFNLAVQTSYFVGQRIALFLAKLSRLGYATGKSHLIGHGLGGQIAGFVAKTFSEITGLKIERITAIDPTVPCFEKTINRVRSGLAKFVDVYSCHSESTKRYLGDIVFIWNIDEENLDCAKDYEGHVNRCRKNLCLKDWLWTVHHPNDLVGCSSYSVYKQGNCRNNTNLKATAGYHINSTTTGVYYLSTLQKFKRPNVTQTTSTTPPTTTYSTGEWL